MMNFSDVSTVLPQEGISNPILDDKYACAVLADYFTIHPNPSATFLKETLIPFLQTKSNFSFLDLVQKYMLSHPSVNDQSKLDFLFSCNKLFNVHIIDFYIENGYLPTQNALLWSDVNWYFYVHGAAPKKEFLDFLLLYLTQFDVSKDDLIAKYLSTCPFPSQKYVDFIKSLEPFSTRLANDPLYPAICVMCQRWPQIEEFNAYLKPLIGDKIVDFYTLHSYLEAHPKANWSPDFLRVLISYMTYIPEKVSTFDLAVSYLKTHSPNVQNIKFLDQICRTVFFDNIMKNTPNYELHLHLMQVGRFRHEIRTYLEPFIGDKFVCFESLLLYLTHHYDDRNPEFIKLYINHMIDCSEIKVETVIDKYLELHKAPNSHFLQYLKTKTFYEETLKNSPFYLIHRTNQMSLEANIKNYSNWLHTDLTQKSSFFLVLVFFTFLLFMLSLCGLIVCRSNLVIFLLFTELVIFCSVFLLIIASLYLELPFGQTYALLLLGVAASEAAVGLGLLLVVYRIRGHLTFK